MEMHAGVFNMPVGAHGPGPLLPGGAYEFEVTASPETPYLSFATMFVQSNDLFIGPDDMGIALFRYGRHGHVYGDARRNRQSAPVGRGHRGQ